MEEKLEKLENIGDVLVTRGIIDYNNGGYTWTVRFLHDADGPCQQRDDFNFLCNSPGNIPKLCHQNGSTSCDVSLLLGTCDRPGLCSKLTVLDESDYMNDIRPSGSNTIQLVLVKYYHYNGWSDGSVVNINGKIMEYKLSIGGIETNCIFHNASAEELQLKIQNDLNNIDGGTLHVHRARSEVDATISFW